MGAGAYSYSPSSVFGLGLHTPTKSSPGVNDFRTLYGEPNINAIVHPGGVLPNMILLRERSWNASTGRAGDIIPCSYIIAFEDKMGNAVVKGGNDYDFNDAVIRVQGIEAVPEPGTIAAIATGVAGLLGLRRRR